MNKFFYIGIIFITLILIFISINKDYQIKISYFSNNISPKEIDEKITPQIEKKFQQIKEISDLTIISTTKDYTIYIKINPFLLNKEKIISKIKTYTFEIEKNFEELTLNSFNEDYALIYDYFIIISNNNYNYLKENLDLIHKDILNLKTHNKTLILKEQQKANYIYFNNATLNNYDITISDIKNTIKSNNLKTNFETKLIKDNEYNIEFDSKINNIEDIKKIALNYKAKNFSTTFNDAFKIEEKIKTPLDNLILYENKQSLILAISKKKIYPKILFDYKIKKILNKYKNKNLEINFLSTKHLFKKEIYLNNNNNINTSINFIKKENIISNNQIFLIGIDPPKIKNGDYINNESNNKITILSKNKIYLPSKEKELKAKSLDELKEKILNFKEKNNNSINTYTTKTKQINYSFDNFLINNYKILKEDIINTLFSYNNGLICEKYRQGNDEIEIILKNISQTNPILVYSKYYKTLINLDSFTKTDLKEDYETIARKNGLYFTIMKFKNPSFKEGLTLQIR